MKSKQIILAIDFDHTISKTNWPTILGLRSGAKYFINKLYNSGKYYIIIWTCRNDEHEADAFVFLQNNGVNFHSINRQHPHLVEYFQNDTRKISADIYIDDKGLWLLKIPHWIILFLLIRLRSSFIVPVLTQFKK